ncbi:hypothetical protein PMSD_23055 [Paenibacillus macquariensis subsp. defensor]|nr:hypothetical protein PMSD_23055 [Paenibacillus macquariensis subsp. defensor]
MNPKKRTLREWRAKRNLTKQDVSIRFGISPITYAKWESKPSSIRIIDAVRIAEILQCRVCDIVLFEENPNFELGLQEMR